MRIATNPDYLNMGYGSRALQLLTDFYEGKFTSLREPDATIQSAEHMARITDAELENTSLLADDVQVRSINDMPPLFSKLSERTPDQLDYLGVSFGLTQPLHKFWKRASFAPVYLRQTTNELTGEHSCIMLRPLSTSTTTDSSWLSAYALDFQKRFLTLLSYQFCSFQSVQALSISESASRAAPGITSSKPLTKAELDSSFSPFDLARLDSYANNMLDYHVILDLMPSIAMLFFTGRLKHSPCSVSLSGVQQSILLAIGLQRKDLNDLETELNVASSQVLAMFVKVVRKITTAFRHLNEQAVGDSLPGKKSDVLHTDHINGEPRELPLEPRVNIGSRPLQSAPVDAETDSDSDGVDTDLKEKQRTLINALPLERYEIQDDTNLPAENGAIDREGDDAWAEAERIVRQSTTKTTSSTANEPAAAFIPLNVSVPSSSKSKKRKASTSQDDDLQIFEDTATQPTHADDPSWKKPKKKKQKFDKDGNPVEKKLNRKLKPFEITKITAEKLEKIKKGELTYEEAGLKRPEDKRGAKYVRERERRDAKRAERAARGEVVEKKKKGKKNKNTKSVKAG